MWDIPPPAAAVGYPETMEKIEGIPRRHDSIARGRGRWIRYHLHDANLGGAASARQAFVQEPALHFRRDIWLQEEAGDEMGKRHAATAREKAALFDSHRFQADMRWKE